MRTDAAAASQAKSDTHDEGMKRGAAIGAGARLVLLGLIFIIGKLIGSKQILTARRVSA
jgi:hypothetical protein